MFEESWDLADELWTASNALDIVIADVDENFSLEFGGSGNRD
jgi:hypothetical protein